MSLDEIVSNSLSFVLLVNDILKVKPSIKNKTNITYIIYRNCAYKRSGIQSLYICNQQFSLFAYIRLLLTSPDTFSHFLHILCMRVYGFLPLHGKLPIQNVLGPFYTFSIEVMDLKITVHNKPSKPLFTIEFYNV